MPVAARPAMPSMPPRQEASKVRGDVVLSRLATFVTVLTAAVAVLFVAVAAVVLAVS
jgi:hypothetical protein